MPTNPNSSLDYTQKYKLLSGKVAFTDHVRRRHELQKGQRVGVTMHLPNIDISNTYGLRQGEAVTSHEELSRFLGTNKRIFIPRTDPLIPLQVQSTPGNGQATIKVSLPFEYFNDLESYTYWIVDPGNTKTGPFVVPNTSDTFCIPDLINGFTYTILVKALTTTNVYTDTISLTVTPSTLPSAPTGLSGIAGDSSITVSFTPGNDGGLEITNYKYSIDEGETYRECTPAVIDSPVTISGLTNGRSYAIRLRAVNANGDGVESGTLVATSLSNINN